MVVVDHELHSWFLLQDAQGLVLDVNCAQSFVSDTRTLRLEEKEAAKIAAGGHEETDKIARSVQSDPAAYSVRHGGTEAQL